MRVNSDSLSINFQTSNSKEIELQKHTTLDKIASLSTRMEVVEWILKYQQLSVDINLGNNPIPNSVGAGFISALHLADCGSKLYIVSQKPLEAVVNTLIRIQMEGKLETLNSTLFVDFVYSQEVETDEHRKVCYGENPQQLGQEYTYCFIGKMLTDLGETGRAVLCKAFSYNAPAFFASTMNNADLPNKIAVLTRSFFVNPTNNLNSSDSNWDLRGI